VRVTASPPALRFVGIDELDRRPHVIADGAARPGSVLTLSHWPASPTPPALWRDLSAEIVFAYLDAPEHWRSEAEAASIDHPDADGLVSLLALVDPPAARRREALLVGAARTGDFAVVERIDAARVAFVLEALCDPDRSPLGCGPQPASGNGWTTRCAERILELLPSICDDIDPWRELYEEQEAALRASRGAFASGVAELEELGAAHLAVVRLSGRVPGAAGRAGVAGTAVGLHPAAVHALTKMPRVLVLEPERSVLYDRYETWVRFVSARLAPRVDLQPLAAALAAREHDGGWTADPPARTRPVLARQAASSIPPSELVSLVAAHLASAPPAWDPFAGAPLSAAAASRSGTSGRDRARWAGPRPARP